MRVYCLTYERLKKGADGKMLRRFRLFSTKDNYQQVNMFGPCDTPMYRLKKKTEEKNWKLLCS